MTMRQKHPFEQQWRKVEFQRIFERSDVQHSLETFEQIQQDRHNLPSFKHTRLTCQRLPPYGFFRAAPSVSPKIGKCIGHLPATNELPTNSAPHPQQRWEDPNCPVSSRWLGQQFENVELALPRMHHHFFRGQSNVDERLNRAIGQMTPRPWLPFIMANRNEHWEGPNCLPNLRQRWPRQRLIQLNLTELIRWIFPPNACLKTQKKTC